MYLIYISSRHHKELKCNSSADIFKLTRRSLRDISALCWVGKEGCEGHPYLSQKMFAVQLGCRVTFQFHFTTPGKGYIRQCWTQAGEVVAGPFNPVAPKLG